MIFVLTVRPVHHLQQLVFYLSLLQERFLVLDDLDGHMAALHLVFSLHYLPKTALPNESVNFIPEISVRVNEGKNLAMFNVL